MPANARYFPLTLTRGWPDIQQTNYQRVDVEPGKRGVIVYANGHAVGIVVTGDPVNE